MKSLAARQFGYLVISFFGLVQGLYYFSEPDEPFSQRRSSLWIFEMAQNMGFGWVALFHFIAVGFFIFLLGWKTEDIKKERCKNSFFFFEKP